MYLLDDKTSILEKKLHTQILYHAMRSKSSRNLTLIERKLKPAVENVVKDQHTEYQGRSAVECRTEIAEYDP